MEIAASVKRLGVAEESRSWSRREAPKAGSPTRQVHGGRIGFMVSSEFLTRCASTYWPDFFLPLICRFRFRVSVLTPWTYVGFQVWRWSMCWRGTIHIRSLIHSKFKYFKSIRVFRDRRDTDTLDLAIGVGSPKLPSPEGFRWRLDIFAYCCNVESRSKSAKPKRSKQARISKMWAAECLVIGGVILRYSMLEVWLCLDVWSSLDYFDVVWVFHTALLASVLDTDTLWLPTHRNHKHPEALGFSSFGSPSGPGKSMGKGWKTSGKRLLLYWNFPMSTVKSLLRSCRPWGNHARNSPGTGTLPTLRRNLGKSCEFGAEIEAMKGSYGQGAMALFKGSYVSYVQVSSEYKWI